MVETILHTKFSKNFQFSMFFIQYVQLKPMANDDDADADAHVP